MSENAKRRSEARDRRRSTARQEAQEQTHDGDGVHQAVRTAAAAAAVGAAVGAARALASRTDRSDSDERDDVHAHDVVDDEDTNEPEAQQHPPEREPESEPEPEVRSRERQQPKPSRRPAEPRQGASSGTVRSMTDRAREQLRELHGKDPESVTSLERIGDGWRITFEVLEVERIPSSNDVLATYVVELDDDAQLLSFERVRRYARAQAERGDDR
jgi:gas vesicle protein GvpO